MFQTFSQKHQKQFILHCRKNSIQFFSECLVILLRGELKDNQKVDVVQYREKYQKYNFATRRAKG